MTLHQWQERVKQTPPHIINTRAFHMIALTVAQGRISPKQAAAMLAYIVEGKPTK